MPYENKDPGGSGTREVLCESMMTVLKEHCGFGTPLNTTQKRERHIEQGRAITDVPECTRENVFVGLKVVGTQAEKNTFVRRFTGFQIPDFSMNSYGKIHLENVMNAAKIPQEEQTVIKQE
eukprot:gene18587-20452_t